MDFLLPPVGEGVSEVELVRWLVAPGATVKPGDPLLEVMSDKATMEVPSPFAGTVGATLAEAGGRIAVGDAVLRYTPEGATIGPTIMPFDARHLEPAPAEVRRAEVRPAASPSVRHVARKLGVDLSAVRGSGPGGRILLDDLPSAATPAREPTPVTLPMPPAALRLELGTPGSRIPLRGLRRQIAEYLTAVSQRVPQCSLIDECDVTELVSLRESLKEAAQNQGVKLTYLPFVVMALTRALREVPFFNSSLDEARQEIVLHERIDIGIAVAVTDGVIVPVIRDADRLDVLSIAREIDRLGRQARSGALGREELVNGTFTLTSLGGIGGLIATPMVPHPQAGILGLGKIVRRPTYDERGELRPADLAYLSLSFDHRILDGAVAATFLNAVSRELSHPARLLLPTVAPAGARRAG